MKNMMITAAMGVFCGVAAAQGYVGAVAALTKLGSGCSGTLSCDTSGVGAKVYFGSKLSKESRFEFGVGEIDAVEFGVMSFGKGSYTYNKDYVDGSTGDPFTLNASTVNTANALVASIVARVPLFDGASFLVRPGLAYVSSTQRYYVAGAQNGSQTETKLKPYLGLGLEYSLTDNFKVVGSFDWTRFDAASQNVNLMSLGLGAEVGF